MPVAHILCQGLQVACVKNMSISKRGQASLGLGVYALQRVSSAVGITWDEGVPSRQPAVEGCHSRLCLKQLQLICQP